MSGGSLTSVKVTEEVSEYLIFFFPKKLKIFYIQYQDHLLRTVMLKPFLKGLKPLKDEVLLYNVDTAESFFTVYYGSFLVIAHHVRMWMLFFFQERL